MFCNKNMGSSLWTQEFHALNNKMVRSSLISRAFASAGRRCATPRAGRGCRSAPRRRARTESATGAGRRPTARRPAATSNLHHFSHCVRCCCLLLSCCVMFSWLFHRCVICLQVSLPHFLEGPYWGGLNNPMSDA